MLHALTVAIEGARTCAQMDEAGRCLWRAHAEGALTDAEASGLAELLQDRRRPAGPAGVAHGLQVPRGLPVRATLFQARRAPRSPDRIASRHRRRLVASAGPLPPALAAGFTEGQRAVLGIVAAEVKAGDPCGLCVDAIAARAGVCRRSAQVALRLAAADGLISIEERRHRGRKNSPNLIRVISREWWAWIRRGARANPDPSGETGCKPLHPSNSVLDHSGSSNGSLRSFSESHPSFQARWESPSRSGS